MLRSCRIVLKELRTLSDNSEAAITLLGDTTEICRFDDYSKTYDYTKYKGEINSILKQLELDGYLTTEPSYNLFFLTQKGLHPYQTQWDAFKGFLFRSILVPIFVSLATTIITLCIQAWLSAQ